MPLCKAARELRRPRPCAWSGDDLRRPLGELLFVVGDAEVLLGLLDELLPELVLPLLGGAVDLLLGLDVLVEFILLGLELAKLLKGFLQIGLRALDFFVHNG